MTTKAELEDQNQMMNDALVSNLDKVDKLNGELGIYREYNIKVNKQIRELKAEIAETHKIIRALEDTRQMMAKNTNALDTHIYRIIDHMGAVAYYQMLHDMVAKEDQ